VVEPDARRELLDRIERRLPEGAVREVAMFGAIAVMFEEAMLVAAQKDLGLLVRVAVDDDAALVARPEAARAEMGAGRSMGEGWIRVDGDAVRDDGMLEFWLEQALRRRDGR